MRLNKNIFAIAAFISLPMIGHATPPPLTREDVRAQLIQAEIEGKVPRSYVHYPDPSPDPARAYVARKALDETSHGSAMSGGSESGADRIQKNVHAEQQLDPTMYRGH